jgi:hypothetical protein
MAEIPFDAESWAVTSIVNLDLRTRRVAKSWLCAHQSSRMAFRAHLGPYFDFYVIESGVSFTNSPTLFGTAASLPSGSNYDFARVRNDVTQY